MNFKCVYLFEVKFYRCPSMFKERVSRTGGRGRGKGEGEGERGRLGLIRSLLATLRRSPIWFLEAIRLSLTFIPMLGENELLR